jgi:hypothetical protein
MDLEDALTNRIEEGLTSLHFTDWEYDFPSSEEVEAIVGEIAAAYGISIEWEWVHSPTSSLKEILFSWEAR